MIVIGAAADHPRRALDRYRMQFSQRPLSGAVHIKASRLSATRQAIPAKRCSR
jgi:hypothetical protein